MGWIVRASVVLGVVATAVLAVAPAREARACSKAPLMAAYVPGAVERSAIVATGRWVASEEREARFQVEQALKGTEPGAEIDVDNRTTYTYMACSPYQEPFHEGHRFSMDGERWLVLLERQVDGLWQVSFNSDAAFPLVEDALAPLVPLEWSPLVPGRRGHLDTLRDDIGKAGLGSDLEFETRPPCNPTHDPALLAAMSTAVVRAKVVSSEGHTWTIEPIEWLAGGEGHERITLTLGVRRDYGETCRLFEEDDWHRPVPTTGEVVVFLRPDDFGKAQWRPSAWGTAVFESNERYVTGGWPTFDDFTRATGYQLPDRPAADSVRAPDAHDDAAAIAVTVVVALLAGVGVLGLALRRGGVRRGSGR